MATYTKIANLRGPQGVQGPRGVQGPQGVQGIPGVADYPTLNTHFPSLKPGPNETLGNAANLDSLMTPKRYKRSLSAPSGMNYPEGAVHGYLDVLDMALGATDPYRVQVWTDTWGLFVAIRRYYASAWTPWTKIESLGTIPARVAALEAEDIPTPDEMGVRRGERDMRIHALRQRIGKVAHPGKGVVALVIDHGSRNFQDIVLPKLRQHGLKSTLAMCATQLTLEPANEVADWSTVTSWAANDGVEIACHSQTHQDVTGVDNLRLEIIESRDTLSAAVGGRPIDSWVQPGARNLIDPVAGGYDGFKDGAGADKYWSTPAGEMIWNGYAVATGQVGNQGSRVYPCTGEPPLGPNRRFIDAGQSGIDAAMLDIDAAVTSRGRCIVSLHPAYIRTDGRTDMVTQAQVEAFIDALAAKVAAGEIAMVQLREWALAE